MEPEINLLPPLPNFSVILLGLAGQGKTSVALELTNEKNIFCPKSGKHSQSNQVVYSSSAPEFAKKNNVNFNVFDTVGYFSDENTSTKILEQILDYINNNSPSEYLDAVIFVIKFGERALNMKKFQEDVRKTGLIQENNGKFTNCIILLTFTDEVFESKNQEEFDELKKSEKEYLAELVDDKNKIILWTSPPSDKRLKKIMKREELRGIYESKFKKLIEIIPKCKKIKFELIKKYRNALHKLLLENLESVCKKATNEEKELLSLPLDIEFAIKLDQKGCLVRNYYKYLDTKIIQRKDLLGYAPLGFSMAGWGSSSFLSSCHDFMRSEFSYSEYRSIKNVIQKSFIGLGVVGAGYFFFKNYKKNNENIFQISSEIHNKLSINSSNFSGILRRFLLEKKIYEIPFFNLFSPNKHELCLEFYENEQDNVFKLINDKFEFQNVSKVNEEIIIKKIESQKIFISWDSKKFKDQTLRVKLEVICKINVPKNLKIEEELENIIEKKRNELWIQLKNET